MSTTPFLDTGVPMPSSTFATGNKTMNWGAAIFFLLLVAGIIIYLILDTVQVTREERDDAVTASESKDETIRELREQLNQPYRGKVLRPF